ncbi:hypothetical protein [Salinibacter altiplanensis]|uniref:hypothetical protein n=1 Tax=Salinibacter altiplanensis TaxID=1803181 RepID=UPI001F4020F0|nr:hypothetical protein [Salinibacter altiplanensis]
MTRTFEAPRTYRPSASLLGRAIRAWTNDRLRGEALYLVAMTGLTIALLMAHYLSWALLGSVINAHPAGQTIFWGTQVGTVLALAAIGLVGFRPAVRVMYRPDALTIQQGDRTCTLSPSDVDNATLIPAQRYHRHYRRYAATQVFVSAMSEQVLCIRTSDGPVIVALPEPEARTALLGHLDAFTASPSETVAHP